MKCIYIGKTRPLIDERKTFGLDDKNSFEVKLRLQYPICHRSDGSHCDSGSDYDQRVREAYTVMIENCFELSKKIHKLEDHKGSLTVTLYGIITPEQKHAIRQAWEFVGEDERHVEFEMA
jgi:hypothetical protein